ncbi:COP1-interactive protein 1-like [Vicia villosa]|uniref:COP1-interactive protein 1-like n=1 Tax=Vicia villosa TaxID=3911 RepID=UPI00273BAC70|nr:COP1-interactive protein 1-like [Vicia villosa]XP_058774660.1 COP1-interactive protein 1-like [Vicia villosa]XP_058774661.1 COP1-interactive protein 1-like [Vicia villosa]
MKKLFFFRSSASSGGSNNSAPPKSKNEQLSWEVFSDSGVSNQTHGKTEDKKSRKQVADNQSSSDGPNLRRSRSMSSASFQFKDPAKSPSRSIAGDPYHQFEHSSRRQTQNSEKRDKPTQSTASALQNSQRCEQPASSSSRSHHDSSGNSTCSSNISSMVVDRFIDGEQQLEENRPRSSSQRKSSRPGNNCTKLPPKVQHTTPNSPTNGVRDKPRAHSFREDRVTRLRSSSQDWAENGHGHESPRTLAKSVIERLSQTCDISKRSSNNFSVDNPITIEDIYARSVNGRYESDFYEAPPKSYSFEEPYKMSNGYHDMNGNCKGLSYDEPEPDLDAELMRRSKEAEERVILLSKKLEHENFFPDYGYDATTLIQTIRNLVEEKISLALEVSTHLRSQIADRASAKEELKYVKSDLELRIQRLEKEKNEMQSALEKELDRRSSDWSFKLEKYQLEEQRLRERVRELAEQNVSLQREVSSVNERETESQSKMAHTDQQVKMLTGMAEKMKGEILGLQQNLFELQDRCNVAEENRDCLRRNFEEKEKECKELHKCVTRLQRTCSEQEKSIIGLRDGFSEDLHKNHSVESKKMQMELMRLTGIELALRKELESHKFEEDSLRQENITLLNRLKGDGKECIAATYRLDKELCARICCLQNQGLEMLNTSTDLCSKLMEFFKAKGLIGNGLDGQFIVESETKIHGLKSGIEGLTRNLQMMPSLLKEKSNLLSFNLKSDCIEDNILAKLNGQSSEDILRVELKAERLVTSLLKEKLFSKELQVEQMRAAIATEERGNDMLRSEVQNTYDNLSMVSHELKNLELQMLKKDESMNCLQSNFDESSGKLISTRAELHKVLQEREHLSEEVEQFREQNMLLKSQVDKLKLDILTLDEDLLVKEGQITILKDSLSRPLDNLLWGT